MKTLKFRTVIKSFIVFIVVACIGSCASRNLSANKSRNSLTLKDEVNRLTKENESYQGSQVITIADSNDHQYSFKISPLDTFTFSLEEGFKGKAPVLNLQEDYNK